MKPLTLTSLLLASSISSIIGGAITGFVVNSLIEPTLRQAAQACSPITRDIADTMNQTANYRMALENTKKIGEIQNKIVDTCIKQGGIPTQDVKCDFSHFDSTHVPTAAPHK